MERRRFLESQSLLENEYSCWIIFDENEGGPLSKSTELEGGGNDEVRQRLRSKFKRCMAKGRRDGSAVITYLDENNSSLFPDGTNVSVNSQIGGIGVNMMVHFPKYYYRNEDLGNNRYKLYVSNVKVNNLYKEERECLVGVFEGYVPGTPSLRYLCSNSGVESTSNFTIENFYSFAKNNLNNWGLIDYRVHKTIANMFCVMYKNTDISTANSNIPCSGGTKAYNAGLTGGTLSLGNRDGKMAVNGNTTHYSTSFLGLEDCYYSKWEFVQGVNIEYGGTGRVVYDGGCFPDKFDSELISAGATNVRTITTGLPDNNEYINKIVHGEYADIMPCPSTFYSRYNNYYADCSYGDREGPYIFSRSGSSVNGSACGVFTSAADAMSSFSGETVSSRLAFYGPIEVKTKDEWLAISPEYVGDGGGGGSGN